MKRVAKTDINTAAYWDGVYEKELDRHRLDLPRLQQLHRWIKIRLGELGRPVTMLDVGCGTGEVRRFLTAGGGDVSLTTVCGVDISEVAIEKARQGSSPADQNTVHDVNEAPLPWENGRFDLVFAGEVMEHIEHPYAFIEEMKRVAGEGAFIIISTPYRARNQSAEHLWEFDPSDIVLWAAKAGDLLFFDTCLLHSRLTMFAVMQVAKEGKPS